MCVRIVLPVEDSAYQLSTTEKKRQMNAESDIYQLWGEMMVEFAQKLDIPQEEKKKLLDLEPRKYLGNAEEAAARI